MTKCLIIFSLGYFLLFLLYWQLPLIVFLFGKLLSKIGKIFVYILTNIFFWVFVIIISLFVITLYYSEFNDKMMSIVVDITCCIITAFVALYIWTRQEKFMKKQMQIEMSHYNRERNQISFSLFKTSAAIPSFIQNSMTEITQYLLNQKTRIKSHNALIDNPEWKIYYRGLIEEYNKYKNDIDSLGHDLSSYFQGYYHKYILSIYDLFYEYYSFINSINTMFDDITEEPIDGYAAYSVKKYFRLVKQTYPDASNIELEDKTSMELFYETNKFIYQQMISDKTNSDTNIFPKYIGFVIDTYSQNNIKTEDTLYKILTIQDIFYEIEKEFMQNLRNE